MGRLHYCLLMVFLLCAPRAWAQVGLAEMAFTDSGRSRTLGVHVWYPCPGKATRRFAENPVFQGFDAVRDGEIKQGRHPLFILLHGTMGNWRNLSWLAARLAGNGAIVAAANHPGYTTGEATPASILRPWDQPRDASFMLGALLRSRFAGHIDQARLYAVGYSLGGYSALALAGVRLDMRTYPDFCAAHDDASCSYFKPAFPGLDDAYFSSAAMDLKDTRFTGVVAIAPGFLESATRSSLGGVRTPALIVGAGHDANVPPATHLRSRRTDFSKRIRYEEIADATHFSFMQLCKPGGLEILAEDGEEFVCMDGGETSRMDVHDQLFKLIGSFLPPPLD